MNVQPARLAHDVRIGGSVDSPVKPVDVERVMKQPSEEKTIRPPRGRLQSGSPTEP
jgi:hypothetical protein